METTYFKRFKKITVKILKLEEVPKSAKLVCCVVLNMRSNSAAGWVKILRVSLELPILCKGDCRLGMEGRRALLHNSLPLRPIVTHCYTLLHNSLPLRPITQSPNQTIITLHCGLSLNEGDCSWSQFNTYFALMEDCSLRWGMRTQKAKGGRLLLPAPHVRGSNRGAGDHLSWWKSSCKEKQIIWLTECSGWLPGEQMGNIAEEMLGVLGNDI